MTDIEGQIEAQVAAAMERHNLKEAAKRLHAARVDIHHFIKLMDLPTEVADDLAALVNRIEDSEWRIEERLR